jgi:hypothetical protein
MGITVSSSAYSDKDLEEEVDEDLAAFEKFMIAKVDDSGPLHRVEKAIIKTYLHWKTHAQEASSTL